MQNIFKKQDFITKSGYGFKKIAKTAKKAREEVKEVLHNFFYRTKTGKEGMNALIETGRLLLSLALGVILGSAGFPMGIYPLGFALLSVSYKYSFFVFVGISVASIFYITSPVIYFCFYLLFFLLKNNFFDRTENPSRISSVVQSSVMSFFCGLTAYIFGGFLNYELICAVSLAAVSGLSSYILSYFCERVFEEKKNDNTFFEAGLLGVCVFVCYAIKDISLYGFSISLIISSFCALCASKSENALYGGAVGLICGMVSSVSQVAIMLCAGGVIAGISRKKHAYPAYFVVAFICSGAYVGGFDIVAGVLPDILVGLVLFLPFNKSISNSKLFKHKKRNQKNVASFPADKELSGLSGAFTSLSDTFFKMSEKMKFPTQSEIKYITKKTYDKVCSSCSMQNMCICKTCDKEQLDEKISKALSEDRLKTTDFPKLYADHCIKLPQIAEHINAEYRKHASEYFKNNKTEILAAQYSSMARIMRFTAEKSRSEIIRDEKIEKNAKACLEKIGIGCSEVRACGVRNKVIEVFGVSIEKIPCSAKELALYMSENCGTLFCEPEFINDGDSFIMRFYSRKKINVEYAKAARAKGQSDINGDTTTFFENDEGYFYALISDGMGSGRDAALTSRLTSVFIEKLLTTGAHKSVTLELLNNLLLAKNDECFATVDLLEVDLLNSRASFIKAGAAPAYIIRSTKLYKVASNTPPAGIINCFTAENTKFELKNGDIILMLSDGILESFDETPWINKLLEFNPDGDIACLCEEIIEKAASLCVRDDDMSVIAARVVEN